MWVSSPLALLTLEQTARFFRSLGQRGKAEVTSGSDLRMLLLSGGRASGRGILEGTVAPSLALPLLGLACSSRQTSSSFLCLPRVPPTPRLPRQTRSSLPASSPMVVQELPGVLGLFRTQVAMCGNRPWLGFSKPSSHCHRLSAQMLYHLDQS